MTFGLLGRKLGHSYSPQIHSLLGQYTYVLYEKEPSELKDFLLNGDFDGLNVTMPYKKDVIPYCDELTLCAKKLGAVNTIIRKDDGRLIGHNTDYWGFRSMLEQSCLAVTGKKILVLGSGGASNTAVAVLEELNAKVIVISRTGENNYSNLHMHKDAAAIVNTTPVGMYPNTGVSPVNLDIFPSLQGVLDVIYNPARTQLLMQAHDRGLVTMNGLWMLVAQAKESAEWFLGTKIPEDRVRQIYQHLKRQMENIILIGMPGSGKTTIGALLASKLDRQFVDIDAVIEANAGMTITDIFTEYGEEAFRQMESAAISQVANQSSLVIATGGGCVTKEENYPLLHQNGTIIWLLRNIEDLATDGRPLSRQMRLEKMFADRKSQYTRFADHIVSNQGSIAETLNQILVLEGIV